MLPRQLLILLTLGAGPFACASPGRPAPSRPNVLLILADDLGYGDVGAFNAGSPVPPPRLDRLAGEGRVYTDAHSPSAVCTPTRYALLTGRYAWRSRLKSGALWGESPPLIEPDRPTIASVLGAAGYVTGCIGKWHLGLEYGRDAEGELDFDAPIAGGPLAVGFDEFFGIPASLDMPPYVYVRGERVQTPPTIDQEGVPFPGFVRAGKRAADLEFDAVLSDLADEACAFIDRHAGGESPFFLYVPLTGPHKPIAPAPGFAGRSGLGPYADFVQEVDATVGRILDALEASGTAENTLVVVTSDNGSFMYALGDGPDHADDPTVHGYRPGTHRPNGGLRGTKADIFEAGHRVPFLVRWPGRVPAASESATTICHVDLLATLAAFAGAPLAGGRSEDGFELTDDFLGGKSARGPVVHHSVGGMFAVRDGDMKLVLGNGSGGREAPRGEPFGRPYQLFDLAADRAETTNLVEEHPDVAARLEALLERIRR